MITLFQGVLVVRLWKWNNFQVELCLFPPFKEIPGHKHEEENIELVHVWGKAHYWRDKGEGILLHTTTLKDTFRSFSIPQNAIHGATIEWTGLITLSVQRWTTKPTSVTKDYIDYATTTH